MTLVVEENEAANPIDVGLLGPNAVTLDAQMPADAVKQFAGRSWSRVRRRVFQDAKERPMSGV
jgi:hypothetical protein